MGTHRVPPIKPISTGNSSFNRLADVQVRARKLSNQIKLQKNVKKDKDESVISHSQKYLKLEKVKLAVSKHFPI